MPTEPGGGLSRADLETCVADLHRQLSDLHGVAGRAVEARIEAVRREEAARAQARAAEAAARRWTDAVAAVLARYPAATFPPTSTSQDARLGTFARLICDEITALAMTGHELVELAADLAGRSSLGVPPDAASP